MVILGFFFEGRSMTELGALMGVTQSRASQIKDEALRLLREGLRQAYHDGTDPAPVGSLTERQRTYATAVARSQPWPDRPTGRPPSTPVATSRVAVDTG
jgi:hypothetical protein